MTFSILSSSESVATLSRLDWTICIGYLVIVMALGVWVARGQHTNADYFIGGRKMNWFAIGMSLFASVFSSLSFVGLPRDGAYADYHLLLAIFFIPIVIAPIAAWFFVPLYQRLQVTSVYEYLERRFHVGLRRVGSALFILYTIGWMGTMLVAVGVILQTVLNLNSTELTWTLVGIGLFATFYTTLGGVKAVVWTDVLQAFVLGGGMFVILLLTVARIDGGWSTVWEVGTRYDKFSMFSFDWDRENNFFGACAYGLFVYMASYTATQGSVQRYVSTPTVSTARRCLAVNGILTGSICTLFFLVGTCLFVFYHHELPTGAPAGSGFPDLSKGDQLLPRFILTEVPQFGLTGLLLAGLFAAAMSSVDSGINNITALVVHDWIGEKRASMNVSRALCFVFGVGLIGAALMIQQWEGPVFDHIMRIAGTFFGLLLGIFVLGMFFRRTNTQGAALGLLAGAGSVILLIYGNEAGWWSVHRWWFGFFGFTPTFLVGLASSYLFPPPLALQTDGLVVQGLRRPWG